jgi:hypothetical protein
MRLRLPLLGFLLLVLAIGGVLGMLGRAYFRPVYMHHQARTEEGTEYHVSFIYQGGFKRGQFIAFYAPYAVSSVHGSNEFGQEPSDDGVSWHPEGLFLDGRRIETGGSHKAVVIVPGDAKSIAVAPDEIAMIESMDFERFFQTDTYKNQILPLVAKPMSMKARAQAATKASRDRYLVHSQQRTPDGLRYECSLVYEHGRPKECRYVVFFAPRMNAKFRGSNRPESKPKFGGPSYTAEGLFFDGLPIEMSGSSKAFVLVPGEFKPIDLTPGEIEMIESMKFDRFLATDTYNRKILPLVRSTMTAP